MLGFVLHSANAPFAAALLLILLIGLVEIAGLGLTAFDLGADTGDAGSDGLPDWLGLGGIPLLLVLVTALAIFAVSGLALQQVAGDRFGAPLPAWLASLGALAATLPLTLVGARAAARWLPRDETTAVSLDALLARRGIIQTGTAARGAPARARVRDRHGQSHYPLVEPADPAACFAEGAEVLLVARHGEHFHAVAVDPDPFLQPGVLP